jgi:poly-gamma-glutamate capsule biosynthesis protein CapA/YwtB (metallophosphatase superfamily)
MTGRALAPPAAAPVVAFGGDVILGERQNALTACSGPANALGGVPELAEADLVIVNLESVIASAGAPVAKGTPFPFYFRGRPELLAVLVAAGIDVVCTANNHSGDFGTEALLEQVRLLDGMNFGHAGSGLNREASCAPVLRRAGDLIVAVFSVDSTMPSFAATSRTPGTCFLSPDDSSAWEQFFAPRIASVRRSAHIVLVAVHCGPDFETRPSEQDVALCRAVIDAGADAVLGSSTHVLQGIEIYEGRPILYDAGNLLWQNPRRVAESAIFSLVLEPGGVRQVRITPVEASHGESRSARGTRGRAILANLRDRSFEVGTILTIEGDRGVIDLPLLPPRDPPPEAALPDPPLASPPAPQITAPSECVVPGVRAEARLQPVTIGSLTLVGLYVEPTILNERTLVWLDTYWTTETPIATDLWIAARVEPIQPNGLVWRDEHEPCNWAWPTSRWVPGTIYRDLCCLRPPGRPRQRSQATFGRLVESELVVWIGLRRGNELVEKDRVVARFPCQTPEGITS